RGQPVHSISDALRRAGRAARFKIGSGSTGRILRVAAALRRDLADQLLVRGADHLESCADCFAVDTSAPLISRPSAGETGSEKLQVLPPASTRRKHNFGSSAVHWQTV